MISDHRRKWRVLAGLLLLLCLVSLLLLPFRGEKQAAPAGLAGLDPAVEPPAGTAAASEESPTPTVAETGLSIEAQVPTATRETVATPSATETSASIREMTPTATRRVLSTPTATETRLLNRTATPTSEALASTPTEVGTQLLIEETVTPAVEGRVENDNPAAEFNAEAGTGTPAGNEVGSSEPVGTVPAPPSTVRPTVTLAGSESTRAPTTENTATVSTPVVEVGRPITSTVTTSATVEATEKTPPALGTDEPPTVTLSATEEAGAEITLTATAIQETMTLPEGVEPTATSPRPEIMDPIMEHMAGERLETQPDEPAGANLNEMPEAAIPDRVSEPPELELTPAPGDVPAPDKLPITGLLVGAPSPPLWVAGGVAILLLAVGGAALSQRCE